MDQRSKKCFDAGMDSGSDLVALRTRLYMRIDDLQESKAYLGMWCSRSVPDISFFSHVHLVAPSRPHRVTDDLVPMGHGQGVKP